MQKFSLLREVPKETEILGRIVAGFGDLEYAMARCAGKAINDQATGMRAIFRLRGQDIRLEEADALIRMKYESIGLKKEYEETFGAMRWSKKIRNQYSHSHWLPHETAGLFFLDLETGAKRREGNLRYPIRHVDIPLLEQQEDYLEYTRLWWWFLVVEGGNRLGSPEPSIPYRAAQKIKDKPPLHNPQEAHPYPHEAKAEGTPKEGPQGSDQQ